MLDWIKDCVFVVDGGGICCCMVLVLFVGDICVEVGVVNVIMDLEGVV